MIKVNLVPREILDREVQRQRLYQASVGACVFGLFLLVASTMHWYRAVRLEQDLADLNREYDKLAKIVAQVEELERTANAVKVRLGVVTGLLKGRPLYPYFMTDLMATLPPGVWLTSMSTNARDPNGLTVTLTNATSNSSDGVSQWLRNFAAASNKWDDPKLSAIAVQDKGAGKEYTFSITTGYKNPDL